MFPTKERAFSRQFKGFDDSTSISSSSALSRQESFATFSSRQFHNATPPPPPPPQTPAYTEETAKANRSSTSGRKTNTVINTPTGNSVALPGQLPSYKAGRVKVGIRCRPAFQDEIDFAQGNYMSIVDTKAEKPDSNMLGLVSLTLMSGKQREFQYDYVFGSRESQDSVYDRIARPVVTDVLKGFNGTIFAYVSI